MAPQAKPITFGGIYAIRHVRSGKLYIGSAVDFWARWKGHRLDLCKRKHHSRHLQHAWDKYGADAFVWEILEAVDWDIDLIPTEQRYLDDLQPWRRKVGYNVCSIAGSVLGIKHTPEQRASKSARQKGHAVSDETRAKIGAKKKGFKYSDEVRAKLSAAHKGKSNGPHSEETKAKIARSRKGIKHTKEARARMSAIHKAAYLAGRPKPRHTPESRMKLSEIHKRTGRWGRKPSLGQQSFDFGD